MNKIKMPQFVTRSAASAKKNAPVLFTMAGVGGFIFTVALAIKATPKVLEIQKEFKEDTTTWEKARAIAPVYIPTFVVGMSSIACVLAASSIYTRRLGAVAAAYTLTSEAYKDYKDGVLETIGEKKEQVVRDAVAKKRVERCKDDEPLEVDDGKTLCLDLTTGGYFMSDKMTIEKKVNELNAILLVDGYISLNDFREAVGNQSMEIGDRIGWHCDFGLIEVIFSTQLTPSGRPCLTIQYDVSPGYDFDKMF